MTGRAATGRAQDRGSAVVEFALVMVPLVLVFLGVVQVAVYCHVRNVVMASAAEGARYAANADVPATAGASRTLEIAGAALSQDTVDSLTCASDQRAVAGRTVVAVTCEGSVPTVLAVLGPVLPLHVTARALEESS